MSAIGFIFAVAIAVGAFWGLRGVAVVLASAVPFYDSGAITVAGFSLNPYYMTLIVYLLVSLLRSARFLARPERVDLLLAFVAISLIVTALGPELFRSMGVVANRTGIDAQVDNLSSLRYTSSNLAQTIYLCLNALFVVVVARQRAFSAQHFMVGLIVGVAVAFTGVVSFISGGTWPHSLFDTSAGNFYTIETQRPRSQFSEPSHLGIFSLVAAAFMVGRAYTTRRPLVRALLLFVASLAVVCLLSAASVTGLVGAVITLIVATASWLVARLRARAVFIHPVVAAAILPGVIVVAILLNAGVGLVESVLGTKQGSQSLVGRAFADNNGYAVFLHSYLMGVGLGSNGTSSLLPLLLSTVGLVGTLLFVWLCVSVVLRARSAGRIEVTLGLVAFLSASFVSYADLSVAIIWPLVALAWAAGLDVNGNAVEGSPTRDGRKVRAIHSAAFRPPMLRSVQRAEEVRSTPSVSESATHKDGR